MSKRALIVGDSLVAGYGVSSEDNFVTLMKSQMPDWEICQCGQNGAMCEDVFENMQEIIPAETFDYVLVLCGYNDLICAHTSDEVKSEYTRFLQTIKMCGAEGMIVIPPIPAYEKGSLFVHINTYLSLKEKGRDLQSYAGSQVIHLEEVFAGDDELFIDGLHPTEEGHFKIANVLKSQLELRNKNSL